MNTLDTTEKIIPPPLLLATLQEEAEKKGKTISDVIDTVRSQWIDSLPSEEFIRLLPKQAGAPVSREELLRVCSALEVDIPSPDQDLIPLATSYGLSAKVWSDTHFSSAYRFHLPPGSIQFPNQSANKQLLFALFREHYKGKEEELIQTLEGYDLSIRPLNLSSSIVQSEAIRNFLPTVGQHFVDDPFGVQRREHLVLDENQDGQLVYLATRKKEHGTYLAILRTVAYCTAGCANCYRGHQTREIEKFKAINEDGSEQDVIFLSPVEQVKRLVQRWNNDSTPPEDILLSGGEPMDIRIGEWKDIFTILKDAKHLKLLRICTGDLFLGEAFRIADPAFLKILQKWYEETGKPVKFATNLPHPNLITPEAVYAILSLHKLGIGVEIQTQTPLEEGIVCFQQEIEKKLEACKEKPISDETLIEVWAPSIAKSYTLLRTLGMKISMLGDRPYKFIHDMQHSVSLIYNTILFSLLSEPHVGTSDSAVRPTSFALFTPKAPNLNIGFHTLMYIGSVQGSCEESEETLTVKIPHSVGQMVEYTEPLWKGINDRETIQRFSNISFWDKFRKRVMEFVAIN